MVQHHLGESIFGFGEVACGTSYDTKGCNLRLAVSEPTLDVQEGNPCRRGKPKEGQESQCHELAIVVIKRCVLMLMTA